MSDATCNCFFFFNDTAPTEIYTLPLPDALPIFLLTALMRSPYAACGVEYATRLIFPLMPLPEPPVFAVPLEPLLLHAEAASARARTGMKSRSQIGRAHV